MISAVFSQHTQQCRVLEFCCLVGPDVDFLHFVFEEGQSLKERTLFHVCWEFSTVLPTTSMLDLLDVSWSVGQSVGCSHARTQINFSVFHPHEKQGRILRYSCLKRNKKSRKSRVLRVRPVSRHPGLIWIPPPPLRPAFPASLPRSLRNSLKRRRLGGRERAHPIHTAFVTRHVTCHVSGRCFIE